VSKTSRGSSVRLCVGRIKGKEKLGTIRLHWMTALGNNIETVLHGIAGSGGGTELPAENGVGKEEEIWMPTETKIEIDIETEIEATLDLQGKAARNADTR